MQIQEQPNNEDLIELIDALMQYLQNHYKDEISNFGHIFIQYNPKTNKTLHAIIYEGKPQINNQ